MAFFHETQPSLEQVCIKLREQLHTLRDETHKRRIAEVGHPGSLNTGISDDHGELLTATFSHLSNNAKFDHSTAQHHCIDTS